MAEMTGSVKRNKFLVAVFLVCKAVSAHEGGSFPFPRSHAFLFR